MIKNDTDRQMNEETKTVNCLESEILMKQVTINIIFSTTNLIKANRNAMNRPPNEVIKINKKALNSSSLRLKIR